jgi:hypothetical protein
MTCKNFWRSRILNSHEYFMLRCHMFQYQYDIKSRSWIKASLLGFVKYFLNFTGVTVWGAWFTSIAMSSHSWLYSMCWTVSGITRILRIPDIYDFRNSREIDKTSALLMFLEGWSLMPLTEILYKSLLQCELPRPSHIDVTELTLSGPNV